MKRFLLLFITFLLGANVVVWGQDTEISSKPKFFFGGRIDVMAFYDSYSTIDSRNGTQYIMPAAPVYNAKGEDINAQGMVRFSIAPTRLFFGVNVPNVWGGKGRGYVEIDFMGNGNTFINMPRIRHAYFSLDWKRQSVLLGQTSHLATIDQAAANTVSFGGGYPFYPLSRPIQARFTQRLGENGSFALALAMFGGVSGVEQSYALMPDLHARFLMGNPNRLSGGIVGGVSFLRPRTLTADSSITRKNIMSWDVTAFVKYAFSGGHSVTIFAMVGTNLRRYEMIGGYAPVLADVNQGMQDYNYDGLTTFSAWLDYNSKSYKGWQYGLFAGLQQNLGTAQPVNVEMATVGLAPDISYFWRIQPRVTYTYKNFLTFGLEYSYSQSQWAKNMNNNAIATQVYKNADNNRITFLARFKF